MPTLTPLTTDAAERAFFESLQPHKQELVNNGQDEYAALEGARQGYGAREREAKRRLNELERMFAVWNEEIASGGLKPDRNYEAMRAEREDEAKKLRKDLERLAKKKSADVRLPFNIGALNDFKYDAVRKQWRNVPVSYTLKGCETWEGKRDECRDGFEILKADRIAISRANLTNAEAIARMEAGVNSKADKGAPEIGPLFVVKRQALPNHVAKLGKNPLPETQGKIQWQTNLDDRMDEVPKVFETMFWLFRDEIVAKLTGEINKRPELPTALTKEDRLQRLAELDAEIDRLGRLEDFCCEQIESAGGSSPRRLDADIRHVLGIEEVGARAPTIKPKADDAVEIYEPKTADTKFAAS